MLTTAQVADRFGVSKRTVQSWINRGLLPAVRMGRDWFVTDTDVDKFTMPLNGRPVKTDKE